MSTTGRGRRGASARRGAGAGRGAAGRRAAGRGSLAQRAVRMRNACVCHAAAELGLEPPTAEDLRALKDDATLREAVEWWQGRARHAVAVPARSAVRTPLVVRTAVAAAVVVLGLALSYGRVQ